MFCKYEVEPKKHRHVLNKDLQFVPCYKRLVTYVSKSVSDGGSISKKESDGASKVTSSFVVHVIALLYVLAVEVYNHHVVLQAGPCMNLTGHSVRIS